MNCINHPTTNIVSTCPDCNSGLCSGCAQRYTIVICDRCNERRLRQEIGSVYKQLAVVLGGAAAMTYFYFNVILPSNSAGMSLRASGLIDWTLLLYTSAALIVGWRSLSSLTSNTFLFLPLVGWVIYFAVKIFIAGIIGPFLLPFWLGKRVFRVLQLTRWRGESRRVATS